MDQDTSEAAGLTLRLRAGAMATIVSLSVIAETEGVDHDFLAGCIEPIPLRISEVIRFGTDAGTQFRCCCHASCETKRDERVVRTRPPIRQLPCTLSVA